MNGTSIDLLGLLNTGVDLANGGDRTGARRCFRAVLDHESHNETAVLWLAYLSDDPYKAVDLLESFLARNSGNQAVQDYLGQVKARCAELDFLISGSSTLAGWNSLKQSASKKGIPLLGEYLLQQGIITQEQLNMALRRHQELDRRGTRKMLGQVLVELGYLDQRQLEGWLQHQSGDYSVRFRD